MNFDIDINVHWTLDILSSKHASAPSSQALEEAMQEPGEQQPQMTAQDDKPRSKMAEQHVRPQVNGDDERVMQKMAVLKCPNGELYIGPALAKELIEKHDGQVLQRYDGKIYKLTIEESNRGGFHVGWVEKRQLMMVDQYSNFWMLKPDDTASSSSSQAPPVPQTRRDRSRSR